MKKNIKCIIFDLDNTIWKGTVLEEKTVLNPYIYEIVHELDKRGIIMSICSKGEYNLSISELKKYNLNEFFVFPMINWEEKWINIKKISEFTQISISDMAFIDDDEFELMEAKKYHSSLMCIPAKNLNFILNNERFQVGFISSEASRRRIFFLSEIRYRQDYNKHAESTEIDFWSTLHMQVIYRNIEKKDMARVQELVYRTQKINTNIHKYQYVSDEKKDTIVMEYKDIYFDHGIAGVFIIQQTQNKIIFELISISCRLLSRKIIKYLIAKIVILFCEKYKKDIIVCFTENEFNLNMRCILKSIGFYRDSNGDYILSSARKVHIEFPEYIQFMVEEVHQNND